MDRTPQFPVLLSDLPSHFGKIVLTSATVMMAFSYATYIIEHNVTASPSVVGLNSGMLWGALTFYSVDGTRLRRVVFGLLGLVASLTLVIDVTGQFVVLDGSAHWLGAVGLMAVISVVLAPVSANDDPQTGILYFLVGLGCVAVATIGLYLEWTIGYRAIGGIEPAGLGLVLLGGLVVSVFGHRMWGAADSAVAHE